MGNPMHEARAALALHPRCGAHCRTTGEPCRNPAMKNGRCRMHGGKAGRPPVHGMYSAQTTNERRLIHLLERWAITQEVDHTT